MSYSCHVIHISYENQGRKSQMPGVMAPLTFLLLHTWFELSVQLSSQYEIMSSQHLVSKRQRNQSDLLSCWPAIWPVLYNICWIVNASKKHLIIVKNCYLFILCFSYGININLKMKKVEAWDRVFWHLEVSYLNYLSYLRLETNVIIELKY